MKRFVLFTLFFVTTVLARAQPICDSATVSQAKKDVPVTGWKISAVVLPGVPWIISESIGAPENPDTNATQCEKTCYQNTYKKERSDATVEGSIYGIIGIIVWGLILL